MPRPKPNKNRIQLQFPKKKERGQQIEVSPQHRVHLELAQMITDGLLGVTPTLAIILARALERYLLDLTEMVMRASDPCLLKADPQLEDVLALLADERQALFATAGKSSQYYEPKYGRLPTAQELTGRKLDLGKKVQAVAKAIEQLQARAEG